MGSGGPGWRGGGAGSGRSHMPPFEGLWGARRELRGGAGRGRKACRLIGAVNAQRQWGAEQTLEAAWGPHACMTSLQFDSDPDKVQMHTRMTTCLCLHVNSLHAASGLLIL